jgi:hypothetical protein
VGAEEVSSVVQRHSAVAWCCGSVQQHRFAMVRVLLELGWVGWVGGWVGVPLGRDFVRDAPSCRGGSGTKFSLWNLPVDSLVWLSPHVWAPGGYTYVIPSGVQRITGLMPP